MSCVPSSTRSRQSSLISSAMSVAASGGSSSGSCSTMSATSTAEARPPCRRRSCIASWMRVESGTRFRKDCIGAHCNTQRFEREGRDARGRGDRQVQADAGAARRPLRFDERAAQHQLPAMRARPATPFGGRSLRTRHRRTLPRAAGRDGGRARHRRHHHRLGGGARARRPLGLDREGARADDAAARLHRPRRRESRRRRRRHHDRRLDARDRRSAPRVWARTSSAPPPSSTAPAVAPTWAPRATPSPPSTFPHTPPKPAPNARKASRPSNPEAVNRKS